MYTAAEALAMLEDASECDLALSDLDVQVIFTLKSIVNVSVSENIIKQSCPRPLLLLLPFLYIIQN